MVSAGFVINGNGSTRTNLLPARGKNQGLPDPPRGNTSVAQRTILVPNQDQTFVPLSPAYHTIIASQGRNRYAPTQHFPGNSLQQAAIDAVQREMQSAVPIRTMQPPTVHQPPSGQSRTFTDAVVSGTSIRMPAVGAYGIVVTFQVPAGRNACINALANELTIGNYQNGSGNALWFLTVNGIVHPGFNAIKASVGTMSNAMDLSDRKIFVSELNVVQLLIQNIALTQGQGIVQGLLGVYWYPISEEFAALAA